MAYDYLSFPVNIVTPALKIFVAVETREVLQYSHLYAFNQISHKSTCKLIATLQ